LVNSNISPTCCHNMVNFGPLAAEICWRVWGTSANFNGFRVLAALLHGTLVVGVCQTLRHLTEGATYIGQDGHHVGHHVVSKALRLARVNDGSHSFTCYRVRSSTNGMSHTCCYSPAAETHRTLASTHFPSSVG